MIIKKVQKYNLWLSNVYSSPKIVGGVGIPIIPLAPPIAFRFKAVILTISPKPKVIIAR